MRKIIVLGFLVIVGFAEQSIAQYSNGMGGYGGGMGGGGRQNGGFSQMSNTPHKQTPKDIARLETRWIKKTVNLTDDQESIVQEINEDYAEQRDNLFTVEMKGEPTPEKMKEIRPKMEELNRRQEEEFKRLFKPEQWELYQTKKAEEKTKREKEMKKRY